MNETKIEWTDVTWNPASGCAVVSEGCKYCYAKTLADNKRGTAAFPNGFDLTLRPHKLAEPKKLKEPARIFVNSMSDLFWEAIPDDYRDKVLDVMEATPWHQYQVLTKRPENMLRYSLRRPLPANMWAGTTIESNRFCSRADILRQVKAEIRFISAEPLLGLLSDLSLTGIHWLISGGESGTHLSHEETNERRGLAKKDHRGEWQPRKDRIPWVRHLRDICAKEGTSFLHKQWGGLRPKSAGRLLDGETWDQYPLPHPATLSRVPALSRQAPRTLAL
jgi:protein gp37